MAEFTELVQALTWLLTNRVQQKIQYTHGLLGDGNDRVRVSTIPGSPEVDYVFVRPDRFSNRSFKVFNKRVEGQDGDPIIIGELPWEPGLIQVVDLDWAAYADVGWGDDVTTTNRHGTSHQWRDGAPGIDTFNVYRRQFGDLKTYATVSGTLNVGVSPYSLDLFGKQYQWPGIQDFSLAGALPTATGTARMALVYWSLASGTTQGFLGVATGTLGSGAEAEILNRPVSPQGVIPSAFVRLAGGQSSITEFDIWDARDPFRPGLSFGTGTAGLSADMIPISDISGLYTGSTVEAALDQIGFDGARVSKVYESDFGAVALQADADGNIGIGTATPDNNLQVGDGANAISLAASDNTVFIGPDGVVGRLILEGTSQASVILIDSGGGANDKSMQLITDGGATKFRSLSDAAGTQKDNIFIMDHSSGNTAIGTTPSVTASDKLQIYAGVATNTWINIDADSGKSRGFRLFVAGAAKWHFQHTTGDDFGIFDATNSKWRFWIADTSGYIGVGPFSTLDPEGRFHVRDVISGFIVWEFDGLDATIRTIISNGINDCLYRLTAMYVLRDSAGAVASGTTDVSNGASVNLTVGGNTVRLRVNADGSIDIARTAGTDTIKVALTLRWL